MLYRYLGLVGEFRTPTVQLFYIVYIFALGIPNIVHSIVHSTGSWISFLLIRITSHGTQQMLIRIQQS